jgi:CRISPR/Cas system CSM-associated protein Csm3 (group 7 of RAMP superfamily)
MSTFINPYHFVPVSESVPRQPLAATPGWAKLAPEAYSGFLKIEITVLTRLFIPSRLPRDLEYDPTTAEQKREHRIFRRCLSDPVTGRKMLPGTAVKGPVRAVLEVLSDSCLGLYAGKYKKYRGDKNNSLDYRDKAPDSVLPGRCQLRPPAGGPGTAPTGGLCLCCRLFGLAAGAGEPEPGEPTALQGRLVFEDCTLNDDHRDKISTTEYTLPELSEPKPWHAPFYLDAAGMIRGRKFYLHHEPQNLHTKVKTKRNCTIQESILPGAVFSGRVRFTNLTAAELGLLLWGLELDDLPPVDAQGNRPPALKAHKLGLGKPLGLGSVKIRVVELALLDLAPRYQEFSWPEPGRTALATGLTGAALRQKIQELKSRWAADAFAGHEQLGALLTFPASPTPPVRYPEYAWFQACKTVPLPANGILTDPCSEPTTLPGPDEGQPEEAVKRPKPLQVKATTGVKPATTKQKKIGPRDLIVPVLAITAQGAKVEVEGQTLFVRNISPYLGIKPQDTIKVRLRRRPDGRLQAEFKGKVASSEETQP